MAVFDTHRAFTTLVEAGFTELLKPRPCWT